MEVWVTSSDVPEVALEVLLVHGIKTHDGCVQSNVLLSHAISEVERTTLLLLEMGLCTIKRLEELCDVLLVRFLSSIR